MDKHGAEARDERPRYIYAEAVKRFIADASIKPRPKASYQSNDKASRPTLGSLSLADINRRALAGHISAQKTSRGHRRNHSVRSSVPEFAAPYGDLFGRKWRARNDSNVRPSDS